MNENDPSFDYLENGIKLFILWEPVCRKASYVNTILGVQSIVIMSSLWSNKDLPLTPISAS